MYAIFLFWFFLFEEKKKIFNFFKSRMLQQITSERAAVNWISRSILKLLELLSISNLLNKIPSKPELQQIEISHLKQLHEISRRTTRSKFILHRQLSGPFFTEVLCLYHRMKFYADFWMTRKHQIPFSHTFTMILHKKIIIFG